MRGNLPEPGIESETRFSRVEINVDLLNLLIYQLEEFYLTLTSCSLCQLLAALLCCAAERMQNAMLTFYKIASLFPSLFLGHVSVFDPME